MKIRLPLFVLALLFAGLSASSVVFAMSDKEVIRAYNGCIRFLRLSPTQQAVVAGRTSYSLKQVLWGCHLMAKNGLRRSIELEHEYQRGIAEPPSYSGPSGPSTPSEPPKSSDLASGTCYDISGCNGTSVHVNGKYECPAGYDSFQADYGGYGCEGLH